VIDLSGRRFFLTQSDPGIMKTETMAARMQAMTDDLITIRRATLAEVQDPLSEPTRGQIAIEPFFTPIGSVEFCRAAMSRAGCPALTSPGTYPDVLRGLLGRYIHEDSYAGVAEGWFVKPRDEVKAFTGHLKGHWPGGEPIPSNLDRFPVYAAAPVRFVSEHRCYVTGGHLAGVVAYIEPEPAETDRCGHGKSWEGATAQPDQDFIARAIETFESRHDIDGYALDVGVLESGVTVVVEWNDGWALGYYRSDDFTPADYLRLVEARWKQMRGEGNHG
jgi:hypothetical protein